MAASTKEFGEIATRLARNPLSIIALFIVFIYAFAGLVTIFAGSLTPQERTPLIYFLVLFPPLVLGVFGWLVSQHSGQLFAPSDFRDEANYVKMQSLAVASLTLAAVKDRDRASLAEPDAREIVTSVAAALSVGRGAGEQSDSLLWVDDHPENNVYVKQAFEAVGMRVNIALSTNEALEFLANNPVSAIISDMGRREGPREGYVLLERLRRAENLTPFFIYAGSNSPEHKREILQHGGQGTTNSAQELFQMVIAATRSKPR